MKCPHCTVAVHIAWHAGIIRRDSASMIWAWQAATCPDCDKPIIQIGLHRNLDDGFLSLEQLRQTQLADVRLVWPRVARRTPLGDVVPEPLKTDYLEACEVLSISPKASAALSRRVLQALLQDQGYTGGNLARQIDAVLKENDPSKALPAGVRESVDAIRNFGNFSAHPVTDKTSLQIIDVESEEAEWCLEIVERLFEHYYVRPATEAKRLAELNAKLGKAGKQPAKS